MSEVAEVYYVSSSRRSEEQEYRTDKVVRLGAKKNRLVLSYISVPSIDLLSYYDKWGRIEDKIRMFRQENELVNEETVIAAKNIASLLQPYESIPDVSVGPRGEIDFDWVGSKDWSLTISVCPDRKVAFAGIFDIKGSQVHNEDYQLPNEVVAYLEAFKRANKEADE